MKRLAMVLGLLIFLSGCSESDREMERAMELRTRLLQSQSVLFDVDITADYAERLHTFSMNCQADAEGNVAFTVTQPQTISGITGRISNTGGELTFDDTALYFELLADEQLSPVSTPWLLIKTLRSGYLRAACKEEEGLCLTIDDSYDDDALTLDIWLDDQDLPIRAEILYDGRRILTMVVKNWAFS